MNPHPKQITSWGMNGSLLLVLSLGHLVTDLPQGALPILLPLFKEAYALSYTQVSLIVLVSNLMSSIIQPVFGYLCDKVSLRWLLPAGVLVSAMGMAATGLSPSYGLTVAAVALSGLGVAAFHPEASKSTHQASGAQKGTGFAIFSVGGNLGYAVGAVFMTFLLTRQGGLANTVNFLWPALITAALLWYIRPQLAAYESAPAPKTLKEAPPRQARRAEKYAPLIVLLLILFIRSTIHAGLTTYIPLYYVSYLQNDAAYASLLVSVFLLAGVIGTLAGGILSDRFGRVRVILLSMLLMLPLLYSLSHSSGILNVVLLFAGGAVLVATTSTCIVLAQELLPHNVGMASGLTIGLTIGMGGAGVTLLGMAADHWGVPAVFFIMNILPVAAIALTCLLPKEL